LNENDFAPPAARVRNDPMKRCPQCNATYPDNDADLQFCLVDGTPLVYIPDSVSQETVPQFPVIGQQTLQPARPGVNPIFAYLTIGLLVLLVSGAVFIWINSDSNAPPVSKTESGNTVSNAAEQGFDRKPDKSNERPANSQSEGAETEREKQKLITGRENSVSKTDDAPAVNKVNPSKSSGGTWFVILGSFPKNERWKADERLQSVRGAGYEATIIDTDNYPGFRSGFWSVVIGPYSKSDARSLLPRMKTVRSDAYIKSGW